MIYMCSKKNKNKELKVISTRAMSSLPSYLVTWHFSLFIINRTGADPGSQEGGFSIVRNNRQRESPLLKN